MLALKLWMISRQWSFLWMDEGNFLFEAMWQSEGNNLIQVYDKSLTCLHDVQPQTVNRSNPVLKYKSEPILKPSWQHRGINSAGQHYTHCVNHTYRGSIPKLLHVKGFPWRKSIALIQSPLSVYANVLAFAALLI